MKQSVIFLLASILFNYPCSGLCLAMRWLAFDGLALWPWSGFLGFLFPLTCEGSMKPTLTDICLAVLSFAGLALFVIMCLAY